MAHVFRFKVLKLLEMLKSEMVFGKAQAWLYSIEDSKSVVYHIVICCCGYQQTPDKIDNVICAKIPDPSVDPKLHQIVMSNMVHGPCGCINPNSTCM